MTTLFKFLLCVNTALILLPSDLYSQTHNLRFQHITTEDGLPNNRINVLFQDHLGFLWFGTDYGLVRYDGYIYKIYQANAQDSFSLSGNRIISINEDQRGNLWIGAEFSGVNKYERSTGRFYRFRHDPQNEASLSNDNVFNCFLDSHDELWVFYPTLYLDKIDTKTSLVKRCRHDPDDPTSLSSDRIAKATSHVIRGLSFNEDHHGDIWVGTVDAGLNKYNRDSDSFTRFSSDPNDPHSLSYSYISRIFEDSQHNLWIGTWGGGINKFDRNTNTFTHLQHQQDDPNSLITNHCFSIFESRCGDLWFMLDYAIERFVPAENRLVHYPNEKICPQNYFQNRVWVLEHEDESGILWFRSSGGKLMLVNSESGTFRAIESNPNDNDGLPAATILCFLHDLSDNIWLGTGFRGVSKYDPHAHNFFHIRHEPGNPSTLSDNNVNVFYRSTLLPDAVWIGTDEGLDLYGTVTKEFSHTHPFQKALKGKKVLSIYEDEPGIIWIGTASTGLYQYDMNTKQVLHFPFVSDTGLRRPEYTVWSMFKDIHGDMWILNLMKPRGLFHFDHRRIFNRVFHQPSDTVFTSTNSPWCFHAESDSSFWLGMDTGLYLYHLNGDSFTHFLPDTSIFKIFRDKASNFWLGTQHHGLGLFDPVSGKAEFYDNKHGLPNNKITAIFQGNNDFLWLGTEKGLVKFDPVSKQFSTYHWEHGLYSEIFLPPVIQIDSNTVWMATANGGIVVFDPEQVRQNPIAPKMVFTDFKIFSESISPGENSPLQTDITVAREIHLAHWQNDISFECAALHYSHSQNNRYAFWLENYDDDWYYGGTNRVAAYTNLNPGEYILHAKGANSDGVWNEEGVSLVITIRPPCWATIPAYIFYMLVFSGIVFVTWRLQLRRIHLRQELKMKDFEAAKLKEVDTMKSQFFANISHEFRTPLTLILGPLDKLFSKTSSEKLRFEYAMMLRNGRRLLRLINQLLDFSQLESRQMKLNLAPFDLARLAKSIIGSFASVADHKNIALTFETEKEIMPVQLDQDKIEKICVNLLSNALKFTPAGGAVHVGLSYAKEPNDPCIEICVSDTGPGIPPEQLKFIFDRFYQVDDSYTNEHEGSGIGLALTKELVELHGGQISAANREGGGAVFTVRLPVGQVDESVLPVEMDRKKERFLFEKETVEIEAKVEPGKSKPLVLIIDDNQDVRYYIKNILESFYTTRGAKDGFDGFEKATAIIPELIISDVMMPGLDGFELCRQLKTDVRTSHIPVILLTAKAGEEHKIVGLETGADAYVIKPFDARELTVRAKNLIAQRRQLRQRFSREITLQPGDIALTPTDERFLQRVMAVVEQHLGDPDFDVQAFCRHVGFSHAHLHRKLRALVDQSPTQFIRSMRLKRASTLLQGRQGNVSEIAYLVGFNNPSYFAECFRKQFGVRPSEYYKMK